MLDSKTSPHALQVKTLCWWCDADCDEPAVVLVVMIE